MERITARTNPLMTHMRKLSSSAAYRREQGEFLCDSPKLLTEALQWNAELLTVVTTDAAALPSLTQSVRVVEVPEDVMASVSPMKTPQGVLFTCRLPETKLPEKLEGKCFMVLDGVQDPGNVGTIWRTADAFGCDGLVLLPGCADPYSPKTVRASMGAVFRRPVVTTTWQEVKAACTQAGIPVAVTALSDRSVDIRSAKLNTMAVVIGSEGRGVRSEILEQADRVVGLTQSHALQLIGFFPQYATKITAMPRSIPDPFGGDEEDYRDGLAAITEGIRALFHAEDTPGAPRS